MDSQLENSNRQQKSTNEKMQKVKASLLKDQSATRMILIPKIIGAFSLCEDFYGG